MYTCIAATSRSSLPSCPRAAPEVNQAKWAWSFRQRLMWQDTQTHTQIHRQRSWLTDDHGPPGRGRKNSIFFSDASPKCILPIIATTFTFSSKTSCAPSSLHIWPISLLTSITTRSDTRYINISNMLYKHWSYLRNKWQLSRKQLVLGVFQETIWHIELFWTWKISDWEIM